MIQSNELRLGNYFEWSIIASMGRGVDVITKQNHYSHNELRDPIPLTEEWLLRLGFKKTGVVVRIDVTYHLEIAYISGELRIQTIKSGFTNTIPVQYVHQLQNLYFALTGEELEFRPTAA